MRRHEKEDEKQGKQGWRSRTDLHWACYLSRCGASRGWHGLCSEVVAFSRVGPGSTDGPYWSESMTLRNRRRRIGVHAPLALGRPQETPCLASGGAGSRSRPGSVGLPTLASAAECAQGPCTERCTGLWPSHAPGIFAAPGARADTHWRIPKSLHGHGRCSWLLLSPYAPASQPQPANPSVEVLLACVCCRVVAGSVHIP